MGTDNLVARAFGLFTSTSQPLSHPGLVTCIPIYVIDDFFGGLNNKRGFGINSIPALVMFSKAENLGTTLFSEYFATK